MRMGTVIGRVTLSVRSPKYIGERLLVTLPWKTDTFGGAEKFGVGRTEWNREVGRALERGGKSDVPGAAEGAAFIRENIFLPIYRDAKALSIEGFENLSEEDVMSYVTRILRSEVASAKHGDLELILRENAAEQLQKKYLDDS